MSDVNPIRQVDRYKQDQEFWRYSRERSGERGAPVRAAPSSYPFARDANVLYAEEAARSIAAVLSAAKRVRDALEQVRSGSPLSALGKRTVSSSDETVATAEARDDAPLGSTALHVLRLAQVQINSGPSFVKTSPTTMAPGFHRFSIRTAGREQELEVYIYSADTHESALRRIRDAIRQSGLGVTADLLAENHSNMIRLEVRSKEPGAGQSFTITDREGSVVAATGIHLTDQPAADAEYRVNGGPLLHSPSNTVSLEDEGLTVVLRSASRGEVQLTVRSDAERLADRMRELAEAVNGMKKAAEEAAGYVDPLIGRGLARSLTSASLRPLGLSLQHDGFLAFDGAALRDGLQHDDSLIKQSLDDQDPRTLPYRLNKLLNRLENSPAETLLDRDHADYMRYANYSSTLQRYSQLPFHGVLMSRSL